MNINLSEKIIKKQVKICVLGLGYIGLPTASLLATHGMQVIGVDIKPEIVRIINNGDVHIEEPGLRTVVKAAIKSKNLIVKSKPEPCDVFIIAVPTPISDSKKADLNFVISAGKSILQYIKAGNLVILESTSPPRTTIDIVQPILEQTGLRAGIDFLLAYSPERVLPGKILTEIVHNSRVIGGVTQESAEAGRDLYRSFVKGEIFLTDATTAEMIKLMENTYRDINIAAANEFSRLAKIFGVNVWEAIEIANQHPRVDILKPGPGVGGHCISVDPWFFVEKAPDKAKLIKQARLVNDEQPGFVVEHLLDEFKTLKGKTFTALGVTYKPDVDDLRESPALEVIHKIIHLGGKVKAFDPYLQSKAHQLDFLVDDIEKALSESEGIILLVNHSQFESLNAEEIAPLLNYPFILDTRNVINKQVWLNAGFQVKILGDGHR